MFTSDKELTECSFFQGKYAKNFICNYREADPWWFNAPGFDKSTLVKLVNSNATVAPAGSAAWYQSASIKRGADVQDGAFVRRHDNSIKLLIFSGTDPLNPQELGALVDFEIQGEIHSFSSPCVVAVPRGVSYGSIVTRQLKRPYVLTEILPHAPFNGCCLDELELEPYCPQKGKPVELHGGSCGMLFHTYSRSLETEIDALCSPYSSGAKLGLSVELVDSPSKAVCSAVTASRDMYISFLSTSPDDPRALGAKASVVVEDELRRIEISSMIFIPRGTSYIPPYFESVSRPVVYSTVSV